MIEFFNNWLLKFLPEISRLIAILVLFIIGSIFIKTEGGIPIVNGKLVTKIESIFWLVIGGLAIIFVIEPFLEKIIYSILLEFLEYTIPVLLITAGIALFKFDEKMRWDYSAYAYTLLGIGVVAMFLIWY